MEEKLTKKERKEQARLERIEEEKKLKQKTLLNKILLWGGILAIILGSVWGLSTLVNPSAPKTTTEIPTLAKDDVVLGNPKSKVVVIEYADFQCPACAALYPQVKQLLLEYNDKIAYVYRFFPLTSIHKNAMISSQFAYAAEKQGKFHEAMDILFQNQQDWAQNDSAEEIFKTYAEKIGLDMEQYQKDLHAKETKSFIEHSQSNAINVGIQATPTLFINGQQIQTPATYNDFKKIIDQVLAQTK